MFFNDEEKENGYEEEKVTNQDNTQDTLIEEKFEEENENKVENVVENENKNKVENEETKIVDESTNISSITTDLSNEEIPTIEKTADSIEGYYNKNASTVNTSKAAAFVPLISTTSDINSFLDTVEEKRQDYLVKYKKKKLIGRILNISLAVLLLLALLILILSNVKVGESKLIPYTWVPITVVVIAATFAIGIAVFNYIYNKKSTTYTEDYFNNYQNLVASYSLSSLNLSDAKISTTGKLSDELLIQAHYFSTISSIQSRALVVAKRDEQEVYYGEIACALPYISKREAYQLPQLFDLETEIELPIGIDEDKKDNTEKKSGLFSQTQTQTIGALGRLLALPNKLESSESMIIVFRGDEDTTVMPNFVNHYKAYKGRGLNDNIVLYLASDESKKLISDEVISVLNRVVIDKIVTSAFISINSYGSKIVLNLSDDLMILPIEKPLKKEAVEALSTDINILVEAVDLVTKK